MAMMKAVRMHRFGGPEVLFYEDAPRPEPVKGEVLVEIRAAAVNPYDREIRSGMWGDLGYRLPLILGTEMSGIVAAVGETVSEVQVGQAIWGVAYQNLSGAYAQYALTREEAIGPKPETLDFVEAASVPIVATTARQVLLDEAELKAGQTILVHGAGGGGGSFVVQLAKRLGARVVATAHTVDVNWVRSLGADEVIDLTTTPFENAVHQVDVVFDPISGQMRHRSFQVLAPGGILIASQSPLTEEEQARAKGLGIRTGFVEAQTTSAQLRYLRRLFEARSLKTRVGRVFPLSEAVRAHALADASDHPHGKIILLPENDR